MLPWFYVTFQELRFHDIRRNVMLYTTLYVLWSRIRTCDVYVSPVQDPRLLYIPTALEKYI